MSERSLRDVVYFTLAWGAFAAVLVAAQPQSSASGGPHIIKVAQASEITRVKTEADRPRLSLATAAEFAE
jgi:hypothetical protein